MAPAPLSRTEVDPELLLPVPRRVRRRAGTFIGTGCGRMFIAPHILVAVGSFVWALFESFLPFGPVVQGEIVERWHRSFHGSGDFVRVHYCAGGLDRTTEARVSAPYYERLEKGDRVEVRVHPLWSANAIALVNGSTDLSDKLCFVWIFALFWNGVVSIFVWIFWVKPHIARSLVQRGRAVLARVTAKSAAQGKQTHFIFEYAFQPIGGGRSVQGIAYLPNSDFERVAVGDTLTVLYVESNPTRNVLYALADWEVAT